MLIYCNLAAWKAPSTDLKVTPFHSPLSSKGLSAKLLSSAFSLVPAYIFITSVVASGTVMSWPSVIFSTLIKASVSNAFWYIFRATLTSFWLLNVLVSKDCAVTILPKLSPILL